MKQGRGTNRSAGYKREPIPNAYSPAGVGQIGIQIGSHVTDGGGTGYRGEDLRAGRGYSAPDDRGRTIYCGGSQRRYK